MKLHALASQPHYADHLRAIWKHLDGRSVQGQFATRGKIEGLAWDDVVLVAGYADIPLAGNNRVVLIEHGAGQRYKGVPDRIKPFYGGPYPDNVIGYLGPRESTLTSTGVPGFAMGSPICDDYELHGEEKVAAITFHWKGNLVCPEAGSAVSHYAQHLPAVVARLRSKGWTVLGHRHPRLKHPSGLWSKIGVEEVDARTVRTRASLLIADNTSLAYEMAYLYRQNISLNAPQYRRDVEHGLRFWSHPPGPTVDDGEQLLDFLDILDGGPSFTDQSNAAIAAYDKPFNDGSDGFRAAAWLLLLLSSV